MRQPLCVLVLLTVAAGANAQPPRIVEAFPNLPWQRPVALTHFGDGTGRIVLAQQDGRAFWFANERETKTIYELIDLRRRVGRKGNEEGLIGLAFDPEVKRTRHVYLHYTLIPEKKNILSRFTMNEALTKADPASEQIILTVDQPYANHNGGAIEFGPDGYLYVALGDGGSANDPHNNAQDLSNLLGKVLRIDVRNAGEKPYAVPRDNPFIGVENARPEIWAYGLRNVWRMSFDPATGVLYVGDVGQDKWEEIDVITKGGNYGWAVFEGTHDFKPDQKREDVAYIPPIAEHSHAQAKSITGGYVYRGEAIPSLVGAYVYGDYETGLIWSLRYDPQTGEATAPQFVGHAPQIASFGVDEAGELYVCSLGGRVYKFVPPN